MANWTFSGTNDGWLLGNAAYESGRMSTVAAPTWYADVGIDGLSINFLTNDPASFMIRFTMEDEADIPDLPVDIDLVASFTTTGGGFTFGNDTFTVSSIPYDSGWLYYNGVASGNGNCTAINLSIASPTPNGHQYTLTGYFDNVYLAESPAGGFGYRHSATGLPGAIKI